MRARQRRGDTSPEQDDGDDGGLRALRHRVRSLMNR